MRKIIDVLNNYKKDITIEELKKYFSLDSINQEKVLFLKVLYCFNISGFYIPLKPSICENDLSSVDGWIELAKKDKKIEYHDFDGEISKTGDIAINDFQILEEDKKVDRFIRIPDFYIYTNIKLNTKKSKYVKSSLTGEDIDMLNDSNNINEIAICDLHEDGA